MNPTLDVCARKTSRRARAAAALIAVATMLCAPAAVTGAPQAPAAPPAAAPAAPPAAAPQGNNTTTATAQPLPPLIGPRAQADVLTAADQAPGTNVNVTLGANFVGDRLPFDVPFNVVGTVDEAVRRLDLLVYRISARADLAGTIAYFQSTVDCVGAKPAGLLVSESSATPATGGGFSSFVNALDPQYFYALCFLGVVPVEASDINDDVREIVLGALQQLSTEEDISNQMVADVRRWMRGRIVDLGANRPVRAIIPKGNLFDEDAGSRNDKKLADNAVELRTPHVNLGTFLNDYTTEQATLATAAAAAGTLVNGITLPIDSVLPTVDSAILEDNAFDADAFTFDSTQRTLTAAIAKASPPNAALLRAVLNSVVELARVARNYGRDYESLRRAVSRLVGEVVLEARNVDVSLGSSALGADLNRSAYVSLDAGIAYPWRLESMVFYAGTNLYFRPINKRATLRYKGTFAHRFALTVGITTTVQDESRRAADLRATANNKDASNSLLLGGGLRVTPSMRIGAGVLVFKESDPNPLVNQTSVAVTPYVAFAADVDVAQIFRSMF